MRDRKVIAIDGPSASGKSTLAKRLAADLGCIYVDSGAVYRGLAWQALKSGVDCLDSEKIIELLKHFPIEFYLEQNAVRFRIDGVDPGLEIRTPIVDLNVSPVAAIPEVRARVNEWLRSMVRFGDLIMEGRDIGTVVFPDAGHKFYVDASPEARARRRHAELMARREAVRRDEVNRSLRRRDRIDRTRRKDPLQIGPGAIRVDTTAMNADEVFRFVKERIGVDG